MGEARAGALGTAATLCFIPKTKEHQILAFHFSLMLAIAFNLRPVAFFGDKCDLPAFATLVLSTRLEIQSDERMVRLPAPPVAR